MNFRETKTEQNPNPLSPNSLSPNPLSPRSLSPNVSNSQARNRYAFFASKARKEGLEQVAAFFERKAMNF